MIEWPCAGYGKTRAQARAQRLSRRPRGHRGQQVEQQVKNARSSALQTGCRCRPSDHGEDVRHSARVVEVVLDLLPGEPGARSNRKRREQDADEQLDTSEPAHRSCARMSGAAQCARREAHWPRQARLARKRAAGERKRGERPRFLCAARFAFLGTPAL